MKKCTLVFVLMMMLPVVSAVGNEYQKNQNEDYTNVHHVKSNAYKKTVTNRKTGGYRNVITNNFYYAQPQPTSYAVEPMPVAEKNMMEPVVEKKQVVKTKESYVSQTRKYFLAHPFFQPLKGKVGSVTDVAYTENNFKFDMLDGTLIALNHEFDPIYAPINLSGKQKSSQFFVKEDVSFGLTDSLALIVMAQYDKTKVSFKDWTDGSSNESMSDSGLNIFGIGIQNRFMDTNEWIGMINGSFLHQKDTANIFLGELKIGYKIGRTTLYGLGNFRYIDILEGDAYGAFVKDKTGDYLMLSYDTNVKDIFNIEAGVGAFAVLNKYFTLNGEMIYGFYDWHNQLNAKGALSFQPYDMFALNLYASTSLYDSAKGKTRLYMNYDVNPTDENGYPLVVDGVALPAVYTAGDYKIKDYNEWKVGVQAILYF